MKAGRGRLIPRKHRESLVLLPLSFNKSIFMETTSVHESAAVRLLLSL